MYIEMYFFILAILLFADSKRDHAAMFLCISLERLSWNACVVVLQHSGG